MRNGVTRRDADDASIDRFRVRPARLLLRARRVVIKKVETGVCGITKRQPHLAVELRQVAADRECERAVGREMELRANERVLDAALARRKDGTDHGGQGRATAQKPPRLPGGDQVLEVEPAVIAAEDVE